MKSSNEAAVAVKRREQVAKMLLARVPVFEIAKRLGISKQQVYNIAMLVRNEWKKETLGAHEDLLSKELATIEADERTLRDQWLTENNTDRWLRIYDRIFKLIERRAKMLGLDAPDEIRLDVSRVQFVVAELVQVVCRHVEDLDVRRAIAEDANLLLARAGSNLPTLVEEQEGDACDTPTIEAGSARPRQD